MKRQPQRALVTGASAGIGLAIAKRLAARGVEVWMAARGLERLQREVEAVVAAGGKAHALALDVADTDATVARLAALDAETGGIDLVVANAGLAGARGAIPLPKTSWPDVRDILHINLLGAAASVHPFIAPMMARGGGHLVGISSIGADCRSRAPPPTARRKRGSPSSSKPPTSSCARTASTSPSSIPASSRRRRATSSSAWRRGRCSSRPIAWRASSIAPSGGARAWCAIRGSWAPSRG